MITKVGREPVFKAQALSQNEPFTKRPASTDMTSIEDAASVFARDCEGDQGEYWYDGAFESKESALAQWDVRNIDPINTLYVEIDLDAKTVRSVPSFA